MERTGSNVPAWMWVTIGALLGAIMVLMPLLIPFVAIGLAAGAFFGYRQGRNSDASALSVAFLVATSAFLLFVVLVFVFLFAGMSTSTGAGTHSEPVQVAPATPVP